MPLSDKPRTECDENGRPITSAIKGATLAVQTQDKGQKKVKPVSGQLGDLAVNKEQKIMSLKTVRGFRCKQVTINILQSWDDNFYVGLTGLELINQFGARIPVTMQNITAKPKDMSEMSGLRSEKRTLDKLIDGLNNTTDEQHMWLIPYQQGLH